MDVPATHLRGACAVGAPPSAPSASAPPVGVRRRPSRQWSRLARPYAVTGGRTHPTDGSLAIEALVEMSWQGYAARPQLRQERAEILDATQRPLSVAEIAAHLELPLGVARVLVADLAAEGHVIVHPPASVQEGPPAEELLDSLLDGLRTL